MGRAYFPLNDTHGRWNAGGKDLTPDGTVEGWVKSNATAFSETPWPMSQNRQHYHHINKNATSTYATNASIDPDSSFIFLADPLDCVSIVTLTPLHETYERYRLQRNNKSSRRNSSDRVPVNGTRRNRLKMIRSRSCHGTKHTTRKLG